MNKIVVLYFLIGVSIFSYTQNDSISKKIEKLPELSEVPVHKKCRKYKTNKDRQSCLNKRMQKLVAKHFNLNPDCIEKKKEFNKMKGRYVSKCVKLPSGKERVYIRFKINKKGKIEAIEAAASHRAIEKEAIRVAKKIKRMTPGKIDGKPVKVGYTLPFTFNVE